QSVLASGRRELGEARTEHEAALQIASDEAVMLERDGQPMGRRTGKLGGGDELRESRGTRLEGTEHRSGLVEYADSARVVHSSILPSRWMRRKSDDKDCSELRSFGRSARRERG